MVVVPGLFQTLDTIERAVLPLLEAHPTLTVLLVAPPGMPNTHWPVTVSLNGEVGSRVGCSVFVRGPDVLWCSSWLVLPAKHVEKHNQTCALSSGDRTTP